MSLHSAYDVSFMIFHQSHNINELLFLSQGNWIGELMMKYINE